MNVKFSSYVAKEMNGISTLKEQTFSGWQRRRSRVFAVSAAIIFLCCLISVSFIFPDVSSFNLHHKSKRGLSKKEKRAILFRCQSLSQIPKGFNAAARTESDRSVPEANATLLRDAQIWTGLDNGKEVIRGDVLLDGGIIKAIGHIPTVLLDRISKDRLTVHSLNGTWVTPGLVDLHSHIGVGSSPKLKGAADSNSHHGPILPWLRSLDGLNTHDESYVLAMAGGVTTAQILPGSANNIGGQAFVIKLRPTAERSAISKVIEPPYALDGTDYDYSQPPRWRHMKHACGENPSRSYSATRMDSIWAFREAYNEARKIKEAQDEFCAKAEDGEWKSLGKWPEDLKWEALVDVLRGRVKLAVHCYEPVDFDGIVRLTNEFKFPVASFHHAASAYLVPDLLKKVYGGTPAIALFASNARKKREAFRGSEFGPRILAEHGIPVVMKSDHPVVNSRYLLNEAALAFYYGLPSHLALGSVTTVPAKAAGLDHRIGYVKLGYDADLVIWDSHPLSLGATPSQVYVDGLPQFENPFVSPKPYTFQHLPETPDFDKEAEDAIKYEGLPPLVPKRENGDVLFINVKSLWTVDEKEQINDAFGDNTVDDARLFGSVLVRKGRIFCIQQPGEGDLQTCLTSDLRDLSGNNSIQVIDLEGGMIAPGLTTFGSAVGTEEIRLEPSTNDGTVFDPLEGGTAVPRILGEETLIRAVDGLQFETRNALLAYRAGVTTAITPPTGNGFWKGLSAAFQTGARDALDKGAVIQGTVGLHIGIAKGGTSSVSTQIGTLRRLLLSESEKPESVFSAVAKGDIPLIVHVENADIMASLLRLKKDVEGITERPLRLSFSGAAEAWRLASALGEANVGVILSPSRSFPATWDQRRILPGPPITYNTPLTVFFENNVTVAIGVADEYEARNTRFSIAWAALESNGRIGKSKAFSLASINLERLLGLKVPTEVRNYVAWKGGDMLEMASKAVATFSGVRGMDVF